MTENTTLTVAASASQERLNIIPEPTGLLWEELLQMQKEEQETEASAEQRDPSLHAPERQGPNTA